MRAMPTSSLLRRQDGAILSLTLNRPERLNALDRALLGELSEALSDVANADDLRLVVLSGAGRAFSSGQDLGESSAIADGAAARETLERFYNPIIRQIRDLPLPVIAAVNGIASGAGAALALACDIVIAAAEARFDFGFARIGLVPGAGCTYLLPRLIGRARATAILLLGESVSAKEAAEWGLIWRAVPDADFPRETAALAEKLAAMPTRSLGLIKQALDESGHHSLPAQLACEAEWQGEAADSEDFQEGLAAFRAKRKPRFIGR